MDECDCGNKNWHKPNSASMKKAREIYASSEKFWTTRGAVLDEHIATISMALDAEYQRGFKEGQESQA